MLFKQAVIVLKLYGCTTAYVSSCRLKSGSVSLLLFTIIRETLRLAMEKANSLAGLSLRAGGRGFSPATKRVAPGYFYWKIVEK